MSKKKRLTFIAVWVLVLLALLAAALLVSSGEKKESIQSVMRDAVLHGSNKISLFGLKEVNPAYISALTVTGVMLLFALIVRVFAIPRFKMVPGKFQLVIEQAVEFFSNLASSNSPHRNGFLGAYIFAEFRSTVWRRQLFPFSVGLVVHCNLPLLTAGESTLVCNAGESIIIIRFYAFHHFSLSIIPLGD